jgi:hypothetical protein
MSDASDLALLQLARTNILQAMADGAGKVSYSIDGQSVQWNDLFTRLAQINAQIQALQGPIEQVTEGYAGY